MSRSVSMLATASIAVVCSLVNVSLSYAAAPDYSAPGSAFNVLPAGAVRQLPAVPSVCDRPAEPLRRAHAAVRPGHRRGPPDLLQGERLRPRQRPAHAHRDGPGHPDLSIQRDSPRGARTSTAPTRADVMFGIGYVTAEDRTLLMDLLAARDGSRPSTPRASTPLPWRRADPALHDLAADRGLPRRAGAGAAVTRAGRPADHHRHRQLPRRHQHVAHDALRVGPALDAERRDRGRLADRRRVRQGRRRRGPSLRAALRASGPARQPARAGRSGTTCASRTIQRRRSRSTGSSASSVTRRRSYNGQPGPRRRSLDTTAARRGRP